MYISSSEYNSLTGRVASECTDLRLTIACKLLDSRIGNYPIHSSGYKIRHDWVVVIRGQNIILHVSKQKAVKMWVASMVSYLVDNNNNPPSQSNNLKLGRFSVGKDNSSSSTSLPGELGFVDSILVSSGIINRKVKIR